MPLGRDEIARLIPHAGSMVMLDRVLDWNSNTISCWTESHLRLDNPLRRNDILPAVAGIEIAGQAMAIHGSLTADGLKRMGLLGSLRDVRLNRDRLDTFPAPLVVDAKLLSRGGRGRIYSFKISASGEVLLEGRASVFFP